MKFPYAEYENTTLWKAVDVAVAELEQNNDFQLMTAKQYVVGFLSSGVKCVNGGAKNLIHAVVQFAGNALPFLFLRG